MPYFVLGAGANCNGPKMRFAVIRRRKKISRGRRAALPETGCAARFSALWRAPMAHGVRARKTVPRSLGPQM